jgi:peptidoglycan/xylan/chitin deacetylase (PgdA/CDA1 family)
MRGAIILMYHSVALEDAAPYIEPGNRVDPRTFERQMAFLAAERRVIALSELVEAIAAGRTPPAGTVCITFDDGYRDSLTVAAPILERYRLPATLFLTTGLVERGENQWSDRLHSLGRKDLHARLLEASHAERMRVLDEFQAAEKKAPRLMLDWDEARELARRYPRFEIGGHTRDHLDLTRHPGEARAQIEGCAEDLRRELGVEPRHFSYPYGRWDSPTRQAVIDAGWRSAVAADARGHIGPASDRYALPRVEAPHSMTRFAVKTSSSFRGIFCMLGIV